MKMKIDDFYGKLIIRQIMLSHKNEKNYKITSAEIQKILNRERRILEKLNDNSTIEIILSIGLVENLIMRFDSDEQFQKYLNETEKDFEVEKTLEEEDIFMNMI